MRDFVTVALEGAGHEVQGVDSAGEALDALRGELPDIVLSDVEMPEMDGFELVGALRSDPRTRELPVVFLSAMADPRSVVHGLDLGADDYLAKPFGVADLQARVKARLERPATSLDPWLCRPEGGLLTPGLMRAAIARAAASGSPGCVAVIDLIERDALIARLGRGAAQDLVVDLAALAAGPARRDRIGSDDQGRLLILFPDGDIERAREELLEISQDIAATGFVIRRERVHVTPLVGIAAFDGEPRPAAPFVRRARRAAASAAPALDLEPVVWTPELDARLALSAPVARPPSMLRRLQTPLQILATILLGVVLPFCVYVASAAAGFDISRIAYLVVVVALLTTAALIWAEGLLALRPPDPPAPRAGVPPPPASAIIAAYLPNEAPTILETAEAFLDLRYPGPLQIILAYNTPEPHPVEAALRRLADRDPRLVLLRVEGSTSKAQNVNAALAHVTGEFVGIFDADHHPEPASFQRAWRWLGGGYDVVQGHCIVRNGDASWVARTVAVEFEAIYAVSHPGRARLHDFGIFGGSNGYWRTSLLRQLRMHGFMLTEDIDSSMRALVEGARIASDPGLLSRELAPTTLNALWSQRMRWAQGWFQVSLRHLLAGLRGSPLTSRQRLGLTILLGWREVYPWLSLQALPLIAFMIVDAGGPGRLDWAVPVFVLTTIFTLSVGPSQTLFAWRLSAPEMREHRRWFVAYLVIASVFYTEYKNLIARVAQIKELTGEREWRVTPRDVG